MSLFKSKSIQSGWPVLSLLVLFCLALTSCEKEIKEDLADVPGLDETFEDDQSENKATSLATFKLNNGNVIEFVGVTTEDGDEMGVSEYGPGDVSASPFAKGDVSIPEMFFALNVDNHPVPRMIAEAANKEHEVQIVEALDKAIEVNLEDLAVVYPTEEKGRATSGQVNANGRYCDGGYNRFVNEICNGGSFPGNTWRFCSAGTWLGKNHWTSGHRRRYSLGITAACHGGAIVKHYYWGSGAWRHRHTFFLPHSGRTIWTRWRGSSVVMRDRRVYHYANSSNLSRYVRCASYFWK